MATFRSHYTVEQIEDLIEHGSPIIQDGHWFRWDVEAQEYVDTGITADSEVAADAAEAAQAAAEDARDDAQDAQTAAETAQGLAEDARDAAAASAASIAASAAQIDANTARINYVALREEEDRQILLGSVVEAAEDTYDELRSAPIHNAITIGQSVYPRMDRTRMAIDRVLGRTVAFNQLVNHAGTTAGGITFTVSGGVVSFSGTPSSSAAIYAEFALPSAHKVMIICTVTDDGSHVQLRRRTSGAYSAVFSGAYSSVVEIPSDTDIGQIRLREMIAGTSYSGTFTMQIFDLTQEYGTTLADQIYAMEQATTGAGVAYVRQRMDLDYYAPNSGELVAPVVSGVTVTGRNMHGGDALRDDLLGYVVGATDVPADKYVLWNTTNGTNKDGCFNLPYKENTQYTFIFTMQKHSVAAFVAWYLNYTDGTRESISLPTGTQSDEIVTFAFTSAAGKTVKNLGKRSSSSWIAVYYEQTGVFEGVLTAADFEPYALTTLPIPTTTLNGVGAAQDTLYIREDGENDYALIKSKPTDEVDMGSLNWVVGGASNQLFVASASGMSAKIEGGAICTTFVNAPNVSANDLTTAAHGQTRRLSRPPCLGRRSSLRKRHTPKPSLPNT